jgi:hypothetical protein
MKRWLVFRGDTYYPSGGWRDLFGSFDEREVAERWAIARWEQWLAVVSDGPDLL